MPVAIYARISSDRKADAANVQIQVTECLQLVKGRGLTLYRNPDSSSDRGAYVDNNVSVGKIGSIRPDWDEVRRLALAGTIDAIVAWAPDRLYRLAEEQAAFAAEMKHKGIKLHFATSPDADLTTPTGIFHAGLNALMAQHENDLKQARIVSKKKQQAIDGEWNGGRAPLGYKAVPSDPKEPRSKYKLVKNPPVARALKKAIGTAPAFVDSGS
ncbi:recombinase family protein [Arthrobacter sp. HMWF013]|uniref:recombinase family protein n=1 Tax=Arthrobacter sp. HMWF013 TaxID=2056849 RepID=UPI000D341A57|nr:recombinase family protein [Arthrobacter sp. HMWF013]PTT60177.1 hypothetical protein DBR22_20870 [Arthrobacter sp. HMWF013]